MAVPPAPCTCRHGIWASYRMNHRFCWIYSNSSQSSAISCISLLTFTIFYIVLLNENIFSVFFSMLFSMFLAMFLAFSASFSHSGANFWQWLHLNRLADRPAMERPSRTLSNATSGARGRPSDVATGQATRAGICPCGFVCRIY